VCAGILHTILFCRTLGVVRPKDVVMHLFDEPVTHVRALGERPPVSRF
jgi:hypothetical protein